VDQVAGAAVEGGAEIKEGARDVEVRDVDMPMFMGRERLDKTMAFFGSSGISVGFRS
jgi:hypothetical protein